MPIPNIERIHAIMVELATVQARRQALRDAGRGTETTKHYRRIVVLRDALDALGYTPLVEERLSELATSEGERAVSLRDELRALGYKKLDRT